MDEGSVETPGRTSRRAPEYIVSLDVGTYKVCCLVAEVGDNDQLNVVGSGVDREPGLRKGQVFDLRKMTQAVERAVRSAERTAGVEVATLFVGLTGPQIMAVDSRGCVGVMNEDKEVSEAELHKVLRAVSNISLPPEREIVEVLPHSFAVDERRQLGNPLGMSGSRLEAEAQIITAPGNWLRDLKGSVSDTRCAAEGIVYGALADAEAVLTNDERRLGVLLVNIGGGTTEISLYSGHCLRYSQTLAVGGDHLTNDIALCLNTTIEEAERVKTAYGLSEPAAPDEPEASDESEDDWGPLSRVAKSTEAPGTVDPPAERPDPGGDLIQITRVDGLTPQQVERAKLQRVIEARVEELFEIVRCEVAKGGFSEAYGAGVVLTGGTALLPGLVAKAEETFGCTARVGGPVIHSAVDGLPQDPGFATSVGLLKSGLARRRKEERERNVPRGLLLRMVRAVARLFAWVIGLF